MIDAGRGRGARPALESAGALVGYTEDLREGVASFREKRTALHRSVKDDWSFWSSPALTEEKGRSVVRIGKPRRMLATMRSIAAP